MQHRALAEDFPLAEWQKIINVNLSAVFALSQLAGRAMLARGYGKIINVASMTSFFGSERIPAYAASKGGVAQLTKALANEWTSRGVCVNAIAPGYMHPRAPLGKARRPKRRHALPRQRRERLRLRRGHPSGRRLPWQIKPPKNEKGAETKNPPRLCSIQ